MKPPSTAGDVWLDNPTAFRPNRSPVPRPGSPPTNSISCVTLGAQAEQPQLYFELLPTDLNVGAEDIVAFLRQLRHELPGPWIILWDRHNIHSRSRLVQAWLAGEPGVVLEDFPGYAPA